MRDITRIIQRANIYVSAVVCGLGSQLSITTSEAQQFAEATPQVAITGSPAPRIDTCYRVSFEKSGTQYSSQGSLDFGDVFRSDGSQCLASKIAALKPNFLYRYHPDPSVLSGQDKMDWRIACKAHCDWLKSVQDRPTLTRAVYGQYYCTGLTNEACDTRYNEYLAALNHLKTEHPLLAKEDYMNQASPSCSGAKCNTPLKSCKVRCEQNLPRQCYWRSWCMTTATPSQQRNFCGADVSPILCNDRVYADELAVDTFMYSFFGENQWPSGQTNTVICDEAIPLNPTDEWKSVHCAGLTPEDCETKYWSIYMHVRGRCITGSFALDRNCNLLTRDQAMGCVSTFTTAVRWLPSSPISLVWNPGVSVREKATIVSFKLDDSSNNTWYQWFGSADTPLLVYDPRHTGLIDSAHQLFGNWTFGGQRVAALALGVARPTPWKNGYQALETLDEDGDGLIRGEELAPLGLWFDANRDARSQEGEVRDIRESGVVSLAVGPRREDTLNHDVSVEKGFERTVDGRVEIGKTVDWFSDGAATMQQLVLAGQMRLPPPQEFANHSAEAESEWPSKQPLTSRLPEASDPRDTYAMDSKVTGVWLWGSKEELDLSSQQGVLAIRERKNGELEVLTLGELGVRDSSGVTGALQKFYMMTGNVTKGANGVVTVTFKDPSKGNSETTATLDEATGVMKGETTQRIGDVKGTQAITYSWQAKKALRRN